MIIYGNKINTINSVKKLLNGDTYIKNDKENFLNIIKNESYAFTYDMNKIFKVFKNKKINNKNILIHFVGDYMLSDVRKTVDKFISISNLSNIEFTVSEGKTNYVSIYMCNIK